tara:strand:- start:158 stop:379 length:222 start_codon:yes stop_codon:yes gene_type:complete
MDRDKLKLIVKNLKLLIESLESEVYSDVDSYTGKRNYDDLYKAIRNERLDMYGGSAVLNDYDEIFDDDDGYPD